jgi:dolichol kinase
MLKNFLDCNSTCENFSEINFFVIFVFIFFTVFSILISSLLEKKINKINKEVLRKVPHILICLLFSSTPFFMSTIEIYLLSVVLFLGVFVSKKMKVFKHIFTVDRKTFGLYLTPISLIIMAFIWLPYQKEAFVFGFFVLAFSDSLASLCGKVFAKKKVLNFKKTYLGSFVFFVTTFIIIILLSKKVDLKNFFAISFLLTFLEFILIYGLDNLFLPIAASYLFYFLL